jgi:hypothetical protein
MIDPKGAVTIPPDARGLLRMSWGVRKDPGASLNVGGDLWARCAPLAKRQEIRVFAPATVVHPVMVAPSRVNLGTLPESDSVVGTFHIWSATRDSFKPDIIVEHDKPLFQIKLHPLDAAACATLQQRLRADAQLTKVRSAFRVDVHVYAQKGDHQLDQGPIFRMLKLHMDDAAGELPPLILTGLVRGAIGVGGNDDAGKVNLGSFNAKDGTSKKVIIRAKAGVTLKYARHEPSILEVTLTKTATPGTWELEVKAPPGQFFGPFAEDAAIYLEVDVSPKRQIRIPVVGNASQG